MTNSEAMLARVGYPISDNSIELALTNRSLVKDDVYSGTSQAFDLAYADILVTLVTHPQSVSEGGFSLSMGDRKYMSDIAATTYKKYGEKNPLENTKLNPKATFVQRW
jgi:hypothetical protein